MKNISILFLILFLSWCSWIIDKQQQEDKVPQEIVKNNQISIEEFTSTSSGETNDKETKIIYGKISKIEEISDKPQDRSIVITPYKQQIAIYELNNIVNYCKYREWSVSVYLENWKETELKPIIEEVSYFIWEDYEWTEAEKISQRANFDSLIEWEIKNDYKDFLILSEINIDKYTSKDNFFNLFWQYMFSIKDNDIFNSYKDRYLSYLEEEENINFSIVMPLVNANLYHYGECSKLLEEHFIEL